MNALTKGPSRLEAYLQNEKSEATRRAYKSDWRGFEAWCTATQTEPMPATPRAVAEYLVHMADSGRKTSTIVRHYAAIGYLHRISGHEPPTNYEGVKAALRGIRRTIGVAPEQKSPATAQAIVRMLDEIPERLSGKRDRAILLLGFAAALRRSELVALDVRDIEISNEGARVHIRRSKTDQEGAGHVVAVPRGTKLRPIQAIEDWLKASRITDGALFRPIGKGGKLSDDRLTGHAIAEVVKRYAEKAGLDPKTFSGHSLRSGFVTSALESGADLLRVMDVTRHTEIKTLRVYDRRAKAFRNHAGRDFL